MFLGGSLILKITVLFFLILFNGFLSAAEMAIVSLNDKKVERLAKEGDNTSLLIMKFIKEPSKLFTSIKVGTTITGLLASAVAAEGFSGQLTDALTSLGTPFSRMVIKTVVIFVIVLFISYLLLVFGEIIPKRIANQKAVKIARFAIRPLILLDRINWLFTGLMNLATNLILGVFGGSLQAEDESITEEEIRMMVDVGEEKGVILSDEREMIDNVFEFDNTVVTEVMTHRTHIVSISSQNNLKEIVKLVNTEKFTRIPVYEENIDNIIGILHVKDLFQFVIDNVSDENFDLKKILRTPYLVPSSKKTNELFKELQKSKVHMAIVIDEYGGTAGIVTLEDLVEEIVGNIQDEYDEEENEIMKVDENTFVIDGSANLESVKDILQVELPVEDYDTLGGFLVGHLGRIPQEGEKPVISFEDIIFQVEAVDEKRISRVKAQFIHTNKQSL